MKNLTISQSEYLKSIYEVSKKGEIKVTKIAEYLNYSKPSVIRALKNLKENGFILYDNNGISLTELGVRFAKNIIRRDAVLLKFFTEVLNIEYNIAKEDSEKIKNTVSCYTITKLEQYIFEILGEQPKSEDDYCLCNNENNLCLDCDNASK